MADSNKEVTRVLIVDDDPFNADLLEQELEDRGYGTEIASGGREALDMVAAEAPDLILLDVMMPDIDGITVCRMLKEDPATRLIPIIIMTALNAVEDRVRGIEAGADDFLSKPVDDRELMARINTALKTKRAVDAALIELKTASEQLGRLGSHTENLSVLAVELRPESASSGSDDGVTSLMERYRASFSDLVTTFSGTVVESRDNLVWAVMRSEDHPRLAYDAALAIRAEGEVLNRANPVQRLDVAIGVGSGSTSVGAVRIVEDRGPRWSLEVEGEIVDLTLALAAEAEAGEISLTEEIRDLLGEELEEERDLDETGESLGAGSGLPWPAEYGDLLAHLAREWGIEDLYLHRVLSGKSGALVYAVDITSRNFRGQAILKLFEDEDLARGQEDESYRHRQAFDSNPEFAGKRLPRIVHSAEYEGQSALLATIAARGLEYSLPWAHCSYDVQLDAVARLSRDLLEEWNASYTFADGVLHPADLLNGWLDYRTKPESGGRIHSLISEECGLDPETPTILFEGHWYPNPLAFALRLPPTPENLSMRAMVGNEHGDLHGYNVLVSSEINPNPYYVIDLAFFRADSFLLFDHGYFELSHLLKERATINLLDWILLLRAIDRGTPLRADDMGLVQFVSILRQEVTAWIDRHEPNRLSYLDSQARMGRVAAGLNFAHKRIDLASRLHGLLYAAHTLKGYLKFQNVQWPRAGEVFRVSE